MAYIYSSDPRLKRHASTSPDAPRDPKRPATAAVQEASSAVAKNHASAYSNGVVSTPAPAAEMSRKAQNAPIVDLKMQINLQTVTMMNMQLKHEHAESQLKLAEADYSSHASKNHFTAFPAMKETKTAAVERAKKALRTAREPLEQARSELRRLTESLVDLEQSREASAQSPSGAITRSEFDELRRDIASVKNDIGSIVKDLNYAKAAIDTCKSDQKLATQTVEDLRRNMESNATQTNGATSSLPTPVDSDIAQRLEDVELDVKEMESDIKNVSKSVAEWVL